MKAKEKAMLSHPEPNQMMIGNMPGKVVVNFGKSVRVLVLRPDQAIDFARLLAKNADRAMEVQDGIPG